MRTNQKMEETIMGLEGTNHLHLYGLAQAIMCKMNNRIKKRRTRERKGLEREGEHSIFYY